MKLIKVYVILDHRYFVIEAVFKNRLDAIVYLKNNDYYEYENTWYKKGSSREQQNEDAEFMTIEWCSLKRLKTFGG